MTGLRIGDAERDAAVSALAEHYAAGRITKDEYDERAERANAARFDDDIRPLFADLPATAPAKDTVPDKNDDSATAPRRRGPALLAVPGTWLALLMALCAIALVATVAVLLSPWLLFAVFWMACAGFGRGQHRQHRGWNGPYHPWPRS